MSLYMLRMTALAALVPLLVAFADTPWRTFGQRFITHRWAERLVLFSIELNLLMLWMLVRLLMGSDAAIAPGGFEQAFAVAGVLLAWSGTVLAVWAKLALGHGFSASFGVKHEHALVTDGPYALVRHPIYTGLLMLGVGVGVAWDSAVTAGFVMLYAAPLWLHTLVEEQLFAAHFGDAWRLYCARVPRMLPWPRPRPTATPPPPR